MTAAASHADSGSAPGEHPLRPGASPRNIRAVLLPEDRACFDAAYAAALGDARTSLELGELHAMLEHWRRLAVLQSDREGYRRVVRRAAELITGQPSPADEPLAVTRSKAGM